MIAIHPTLDGGNMNSGHIANSEIARQYGRHRSWQHRDKYAKISLAMLALVLGALLSPGKAILIFTVFFTICLLIDRSLRLIYQQSFDD